MHLSTRRTKLCIVTTAMSIAACTCAVTVPSSVFTQTAEAAPIVSTTSAPAATGSVSSAAGDTRAATTPDPVSVPAAGSLAQPASSTQSGTSLAQPDSSSTTTSANKPVSATAQPVAGTTDDSLTWTKDDFNISADGKTIGGRKNVYHPETNQTVNEYVDGLSAQGKEKLKKNHHIVIPEGIEVIHECAFTGHAKQVGNKHEHIDGETYIEGVTLPQSLKIIEYGAFGWNKIKGTVVIPKNVISIHSAAFVANEIERVVFEGVLDGNGKEHDTDAKPYYLAGVGEKAFQGNKIREILVKKSIKDYKFGAKPDNPTAAPFSNQELDTITVEVGEVYKTPIKITQENASQVNAMEGFFQSGHPVLIGSSSNFQMNDKGEYVAKTPGTLDALVMLYDLMNGDNRNIASARFKYEILPQGSLCTVTFNSENAVLSKIRVRKGKSVTEGAVNGQHMPADPSKKGYEFKGWNTKSDGTGDAFSATTIVNGDWNVFAVFSKNSSPSPAPNPGPIPQLNPVPKLQPKPVPAPTPTPDKVPAVQQEAPTKTPIPAPPAPEQPVPVPNDTPAPEPPARSAGEQHVQQARMPRTSDMALLGVLASTSALACAVVCGAITALKRRK